MTPPDDSLLAEMIDVAMCTMADGREEIGEGIGLRSPPLWRLLHHPRPIADPAALGQVPPKSIGYLA